LKIENPCNKYSPNAWIAWEDLSEDFKPVVEKLLIVLLSRVPKYGLSYRENDDISYYFSRLKEEIKEFEKESSITEAADIANFAMMIIYHQLRKERSRIEPYCINIPHFFSLEVLS